MLTINAIAVDAALHHSAAFSEKRWGKWLSSILMLLICLSTMFVKQHSVLDFLGGVIVSIFFYVPLYGLERRKTIEAEEMGL